MVVTGAGQGLGRAFALDAARHGASVVVNDVDEPLAAAVTHEIESEGGTAVSSGHSVTEWSQAQALIEQCVHGFGSIDGLVNNAGYFYTCYPWDDEQELRTIMEVNVLGTAYVEHMRLST